MIASRRDGPRPGLTKRAGKSRKRADAEGDRDGWLCPIEAERPSAVAGQSASEERRGTEAGTTARRAWSESFLLMNLGEYLSLLDWTGRQLRSDKRGAIPAELAPILTCLGIASENWLECVSSFGRWFHRAAGRADRILSQAARAGRRWLQGIAPAREAFL